MNNNCLLTESIIKRECLLQFSRITGMPEDELRHKLKIHLDQAGDRCVINLAYSDKHAGRFFGIGLLQNSLEEFSDEVIKPLCDSLSTG